MRLLQIVHEFFGHISSAVDVVVVVSVCVYDKHSVPMYTIIVRHIIYILGRIKYYYHKIKLEHDFAS